MRFQLFIALVFFLTPYFSQGILSHSNSDAEPDEKGIEDKLVKLYKPVEDMVRSGLFVWDRRSNPKSMSIRLPVDFRDGSSIRDDMMKRCPASLKILDKEIKNYNDSYGGYNLQDSTDNIETLEGFYGVIYKIKSGVSACVRELRQDYIDLSFKFVKPLNESYPAIRIPDSYSNIVYLNYRFIKFIRSHRSSEGRLSQMRTQLLSYNDFQDRCITAYNTSEGVNEVFSSFYPYQIASVTHQVPGQFQIKKSFTMLRDFFSKDDHCWSKMKEFNSFADSGLFKEFVGLPQRCKGNDSEIESLKKAVLVVDNDENRNTSFPDVLNYCREELEKTSSVCFCGSEDCNAGGGGVILQS